MKLLKLQALSNFTTSLGITGALIFMTGSASCLIVLLWGGIIAIGNILYPHQSTLQKMTFYGSASVGAGLFVAGASGWIAGIGEKMASEELRHLEEEVKKHYPKPSTCEECKHFHGVIYNEVPLICGYHPYGVDKENCPDWEKK